MEMSYQSYLKEIQKMKNLKYEGGKLLDYEDALGVVRDLLKQKMLEMEQNLGKETEKEKVVKDKEYLRNRLETHKSLIEEIVVGHNIRVRGYEDINDFVKEAVDDIAGYSIFADAFADKEVSDIFALKWDTIFVEKNGKNVKYHRKFRSQKHFEDTLEHFMSEAGKALNNGDQKIVDFELYGDRGCATSDGVSPKGASLTIRKHAEDHITRDQIVEWNVMNEKMADLLGMLVLGESNIIYAGLTGSGKTTTIRALLDHYVTQAGKRMLVCEDTQELFPKNEHTLELVSVKSGDKNVAVTLGQLIITALRLKPKYIVVGEVRGEEAVAAVEGMETGHSTIFTMHGGTPWNIVNRLVTKYMMGMPSLGIDVVERIIGSSLDYICIQDNIPGIGRKCTSIVEVTYNFITRRVEMKTICRFDFKTKDFVFEGKISREKADTMMRRGVSWEQLAPWIEEEVADVA